MPPTSLRRRAGVYAEMEFLAAAWRDGRVQQSGAIRDILERVAKDDQVMEQARQRAVDLLAHGQT